MKYLLLLLLFTVSVSAQTITERWNNLSSRYEYFSSDGTMVGYKKYNSLRHAWEYYEVETEPSYQPRSNVNVDLTRQALQQKQQRYDYNKQRIQGTIDKIRSDFSLLGLSKEDEKYLLNTFQTKYVNALNGQSYDLSYNETADKIINWLYAGAAQILKSLD